MRVCEGAGWVGVGVPYLPRPQHEAPLRHRLAQRPAGAARGGPRPLVRLDVRGLRRHRPGPGSRPGAARDRDPPAFAGIAVRRCAEGELRRSSDSPELLL